MLLYDAVSPYGLVYLAGTLLMLALLLLKLRLKPADALFYTVFTALFTIAGGRLGYAAFYEAAYFLNHPLELFALYQGGMSFHGALLGFLAALVLFIRDPKLRLQICDLAALCALFTLPIGRVMNYLGGEIYGTPAPDGTPFAVIYPVLDFKLRHAVVLYEAAGYFIFVLPMLVLLKKHAFLNFAGAFACSFAALQAVLRFSVDFWREPDLSLGYIGGVLGLGQLLALGQFALVVLLFIYLKQKAPKHPA